MLKTKREFTCANCYNKFSLHGNANRKKYCYICGPKIALAKNKLNKQRSYEKVKARKLAQVGGQCGC